MQNFIALLTGLLVSVSVFGQTDSTFVETDSIVSIDTMTTPSLWRTVKTDARSSVHGFLYTLAQPTRWDKTDYLYAGATVVGTGIIYLNDQSISDYFRQQDKKMPHLISESGFRIGKPLINYGLTGGVYLTGLLTKNDKIRYTGILMITSASVSGLVQQVVKTAAGRARPSANLGHDHFKPFEGSPAYSSFPSGHTALSVTTFYALSKQFKDPWVKAGFYTLGMVSPISRIWEGAHWASDVFLSTVMSVAIVECVDSYLKRDQKVVGIVKANQIKWNLKMGHNQIGLVGVF